MRWKVSSVTRRDDGSFCLQVDVTDDDAVTILTRTYVYAAPGMPEADVRQACGDAAREAHRLDSERRAAEAQWVGLGGEVQ